MAINLYQQMDYNQWKAFHNLNEEDYKDYDCPKCGGKGTIICGDCDGEGSIECCECGHWAECEECEGTGSYSCDQCTSLRSVYDEQSRNDKHLLTKFKDVLKEA